MPERSIEAPQNESQSEPTIACTLTPDARAARHRELTEQLFRHALEIVELDDGYAYQFPGEQDFAEKLTGFVLYERQCCPFFTFDLTFEPEQGPVTLKLRGPDGTREFLAGFGS